MLRYNKDKNGHLFAGDYEIIKSMTDTIVCLNQALGNKKIPIKRLLKMLCKKNRVEQLQPLKQCRQKKRL